MREVVMVGAEADDVAAACSVWPTSYRSLIQLFNTHYDGGTGWIEMSSGALDTWFRATEQASLRTTLWAVWRRARAVMAASGDKCLTRCHFDGVSRELEHGTAGSPSALVGTICSTRQVGAATPSATAATETNVSWQRISRCDGPSLTISSGTRTTTASACAGTVVPVPGAKRPHSAISGGDDKDNDDPVVTARRQRVATDHQEADRLRSGLAGAATLGDLGLMIQAAVRLTSVYPADDVRALVAGAYPARRAPGRRADGDPAQGVDGNEGQRAASLWAPTAFVEWFASHHAAYGLENTPDYVWNTKLLPTSPREDDPWSRAYWLAANAKP
ncbi:hypothetical protein pclt_cds_7 [Pandoravirus celtis]|uniref:Uncharacterized protein n=1 Tax=Pandoravirus celtis TaxID=2568002 RepID=A0A4D6EGC5_9VIRU|nr:hypothetical protein pclt_cds_7 [Pandoravirus celtis]